MINELIRKTDVLDLLNDLANDFGDNYELYSTLFDSVDGMEAANVEKLPKTGHWICDYKGDHVADYHCSECGRQLGFAFSTQSKKILGGRWKYCDVCGAKMEGEAE